MVKTYERAWYNWILDILMGFFGGIGIAGYIIGGAYFGALALLVALLVISYLNVKIYDD